MTEPLAPKPKAVDDESSLQDVVKHRKHIHEITWQEEKEIVSKRREVIEESLENFKKEIKGNGIKTEDTKGNRRGVELLEFTFTSPGEDNYSLIIEKAEKTLNALRQKLEENGLPAYKIELSHDTNDENLEVGFAINPNREVLELEENFPLSNDEEGEEFKVGEEEIQTCIENSSGYITDEKYAEKEIKKDRVEKLGKEIVQGFGEKSFVRASSFRGKTTFEVNFINPKRYFPPPNIEINIDKVKKKFEALGQRLSAEGLPHKLELSNEEDSSRNQVVYIEVDVSELQYDKPEEPESKSEEEEEGEFEITEEKEERIKNILETKTAENREDAIKIVKKEKVNELAKEILRSEFTYPYTEMEMGLGGSISPDGKTTFQAFFPLNSLAIGKSEEVLKVFRQKLKAEGLPHEIKLSRKREEKEWTISFEVDLSELQY